MITRLRRRLRRQDPEAGMGEAVELVILAPVLLLFLGLILLGGRINDAETTTQSAARDAARAASISRNAVEADTRARSTASSALSSDGLRCTSTDVTVNTDAFALPAGQAGQVTVSVTCIVPLSDISLPGIPGERVITATASSVIDTYRERA